MFLNLFLHFLMSLSLNKYRVRGIVAAIFLVYLACGCEQIVDFPDNKKEFEKRLVVEGSLTDIFEEQMVRVTYTLPLSDSLSCELASNAIVEIYSNFGDTVSFKYQENGWYKSAAFAAEEGKLYTLEVKIGDFVAKSVSYCNPGHPIDSLYYRRYRLSEEKDSVYHLHFDVGIVDPNNIRYYMLEVYRNHKELTAGDEVWMFSDKNLISVTNIEIPAETHIGDTVDVELHSLTEPMFNYLSAYSKVIFSDVLINQNYRENPPTMFDQNVLGYFKVSSIHSKRIIIGK